MGRKRTKTSFDASKGELTVIAAGRRYAIRIGQRLEPKHKDRNGVVMLPATVVRIDTAGFGGDGLIEMKGIKDGKTRASRWASIRANYLVPFEQLAPVPAPKAPRAREPKRSAPPLDISNSLLAIDQRLARIEELVEVFHNELTGRAPPDEKRRLSFVNGVPVPKVRIDVRAHLVVDNAARFYEEDLPPELADRLREICRHRNPKRAQAKRMGHRFGYMPEHVETWWRDDAGRLCLPRGAIVKARQIVEEWGSEHERVDLLVADRRTAGDLALGGRIPPHNVRLRPYQQEAVAAVLAHQNGLLRSATGSGKSTIALAAVAALSLPAIVIVWSARLFDQWMERIVSELGLSESEVGVVQGKTQRLRQVTVAMLQTLARQPPGSDVFTSFGVVVADEVQRWAAPTARRALEPFTARYKIGVSADEKRKDRLEGMIYEQFGRVIYDPGKKGQAQMEASGAIVPVEVVIVPTAFRAPWYSAPGGDYTRLMGEMALDDDRTALACDFAERGRAQGHQVVALTLRREHARELAVRLGTPSLLLGSAEDAAGFEESKRVLRDGEERMAVGTVQAFGTGIDIPSISWGVLAMPVFANRQLLNQVAGRFCRPSPGKTRGVLYCLFDEEVFGLTQIVEVARRFPGRTFVQRPEGPRTSVEQYLEERRALVKERERVETGGAFG